MRYYLETPGVGEVDDAITTPTTPGTAGHTAAAVAEDEEVEGAEDEVGAVAAAGAGNPRRRGRSWTRSLTATWRGPRACWTKRWTSTWPTSRRHANPVNQHLPLTYLT